MSFVVRAANRDDVSQLYELSRQFTLLNLPSDKKVIAAKLERSEASFAGKMSKADAEYMFVVADLDGGLIAGCSQIVAKNGTPSSPNFSFKIEKRERFSKELGVGFIHQILRLQANYDGPTEVGGLVVDRGYRRRPEKVGKLISLSRFLYIGSHRDRFESELHAEMAPPLTDEGRSEFWEALGRRFTGMPYQEADVISQQNNTFIKSLFPEEDIYLCLLDSKARLVLGRVAEETQAALHLLSRLGFSYKDEVDPFDGGPHLGCKVEDLTLLKKSRLSKAGAGRTGPFSSHGLVALSRDGEFFCTSSALALEGDEVFLPEVTKKKLSVEMGENVLVALD